MAEDLILDETNRTKLDGIVQQMTANQESDADIQFVVNDFKSKYGVKNKVTTPDLKSGGKTTSQSVSILTSTSPSKSIQGVPGFKQIAENSLNPNIQKNINPLQGVSGISKPDDRFKKITGNEYVNTNYLHIPNGKTNAENQQVLSADKIGEQLANYLTETKQDLTTVDPIQFKEYLKKQNNTYDRPHLFGADMHAYQSDVDAYNKVGSVLGRNLDLAKSEIDTKYGAGAYDAYQKQKQDFGTTLETELPKIDAIDAELKSLTEKKPTTTQEYQQIKQQFDDLQQQRSAIADPLTQAQTKIQQFEGQPEFQKIKYLTEVQQALSKKQQGLLDKYPEAKATLESNEKTQKWIDDYSKLLSKISPVGAMGLNLVSDALKTVTGLAHKLSAIPEIGEKALGIENSTLLTPFDFFTGLIHDASETLDNKAKLTTPSNMELPVSQKFKLVDGNKIFLDKNNKPTFVRDADGYKIDRQQEQSIIDAYNENPDKTKIPIHDKINWNVALNEASKFGMDIMAMGEIGKGLNALGLTGSSAKTWANGTLTLMGYGLNDAYENAKASAPNLTDQQASLYALGSQAAIGSVFSLFGGAKMKYITGEGGESIFEKVKGFISKEKPFKLTAQDIQAIDNGASAYQVAKAKAQKAIGEALLQGGEMGVIMPALSTTVNKVTNGLAGYHALNDDLHIDKESLTNSALPAMLVGAITGGMSVGSSEIKSEAWANINKDEKSVQATIDFLDKSVEDKLYTQEQVDKIKQRIQYTQENIKPINGVSDIDKKVLSNLYDSKFQLQEQADKFSDSGAKKAYTDKIREIDNDIAQVINKKTDFKSNITTGIMDGIDAFAESQKAKNATDVNIQSPDINNNQQIKDETKITPIKPVEQGQQNNDGTGLSKTPKDDSAIQSGGEQKLPDQKEVPIEQKQEVSDDKLSRLPKKQPKSTWQQEQDAIDSDAALTNEQKQEKKVEVTAKALEGLKEFKAESDRYFEYVPIEEIEKYKEFDRATEKKWGSADNTLKELVADIQKNGIKTPITLQVDINNNALVVEGNTRLAAAKKLGIKNIPVRIISGEFGSINKDKTKKLGRKRDIGEMSVFYPYVNILNQENSPAKFGFTSITNTKNISEAYHKAKADGSNPELVKAVEDLLGKAPTQYTEAATPAKKESEGVSGSALKDVVSYEDAIKITPTSELTNPEKYGTDELGMEAKTAALRDEEKTPPKFTDYKVGTYAKDRFGDLYQLQNVPIDKIVLPEGEQKREATVEKYKKWYNEGSKFPPAKGVENYAVYDGKIVINDGHHRVIAAKQLGLKEVPVWVSLTDPKNPARPITDIEYHKSLTKAPTQYTEAATPKDDSAIQSGGEQKLPDQKEVPIEQKQEVSDDKLSRLPKKKKDANIETPKSVKAVEEALNDKTKTNTANSAILDEIKSKNLTHVRGKNMGENQALGTFVSTEKGNRYETKDNKAEKVEVDIKNPLVVDNGDFGLVDKRQEILNANRDKFDEYDTVDYQKLPDGKLTVDNLNDTGIKKLAELTTNELKAQGYDGIYFRESGTQEGELVVFDKSNVKFKGEEKPQEKSYVDEVLSKAEQEKKDRKDAEDKIVQLTSAHNATGRQKVDDKQSRTALKAEIQKRAKELGWSIKPRKNGYNFDVIDNEGVQRRPIKEFTPEQKAENAKRNKEKKATFDKVVQYDFHDITDKVLQYFGTGGKINSEDLKRELLGDGKGGVQKKEWDKKIGMQSGDAPNIDRIIEGLYANAEDTPSDKEQTEARKIILDVLGKFDTASEMRAELLGKMDNADAIDKQITQQEADAEIINQKIMEKGAFAVMGVEMPEEMIKDLEGIDFLDDADLENRENDKYEAIYNQYVDNNGNFNEEQFKKDVENENNNIKKSDTGGEGENRNEVGIDKESNRRQAEAEHTAETKRLEAEVEKTNRQKATEKRKIAKEKLDAFRNKLGIISNPKEEANLLFDYHKALVVEAKEYIKEVGGDIHSWAKDIGEKVSYSLKTAWDEATGKIKPIDNADYFDQKVLFNDAIQYYKDKGLSYEEVKSRLDKNEVDYEEADLKDAWDGKEEPAKEKSGGSVTGISIKAREKRAEELKTTATESGQGWTGKDALERGQELLNKGADANKVIEEYNRTKKISGDDIAILQAHANELARETNQAGEKFGIDSPEYNDALKKEQDFLDAAKPLSTESHLAFAAHQGASDVDTGSWVGMVRQFEADNGKKPTKQQVEEIKKLSEQVNKETKRADDLQQQLYDELNKIHDTIPKEEADNLINEAYEKGKKDVGSDVKKFTKKAKELADRFRQLKSKPLTLKDENGNEIKLTQNSILSLNDIIELGAKAIETTGKIADGISVVLDKLKEQDFYKNLSDKGKEAVNKQVEEHFNSTAESKEKLGISQNDARDLFNEKIKDNPDYNITDLVNDIIKENPDLEGKEREVRDEITGYGETKTPNEEDAQFRKAKRLGRIISALEDIANGERPKKSGLQRDTKDPEERAKVKELADALKKLPLSDADLNKKLKTAQDTIVTRLNNEIADMQREIDNKKRNVRPHTATQTTKEIEDLKVKRDAKKAERDALFAHETGKDIQEYFANRTDGDFTLDETRMIWKYAKEKYVDKGISDFNKMTNAVATDLGLSQLDVINALAKPKSARTISDEMYKTQSRRRDAINNAKHFIKSANEPALNKFLKYLPTFWFQKAVFGHGTVGMITHAGVNMFRPTEWGTYFRNFVRQFQFVNKVTHEKFMTAMQNEADFTFWKRHGLAIEPHKIYDDYQAKRGTGWISELSKVGDRGFDALKVYRYEQAKNIWSNLNDYEKTPESAKAIARMVNASTGTVEGQVNPLVSSVIFAPKLEASRWKRLVKTPIETANTFKEWKTASVEDKILAKLAVRRTGETLATMAVMLAANQAILSLFGDDKTKINFTDPTESDFLKFKVADKTVDISGGMFSTVRFIATLAELSAGEVKGNKNIADEMYKKIGKQIRGKLSPFFSTTTDIATHKDFAGNVLPFYSDSPGKYGKKLSWWDYIGQSQLPIPISAAWRDIKIESEKNNDGKTKVNDILSGIITGATMGFTGAHVGEDYSKDDKKEESVLPAGVRTK